MEGGKNALCGGTNILWMGGKHPVCKGTNILVKGDKQNVFYPFFVKIKSVRLN